MDDAVVVIADRLELWMIDEFEYRKQTDENMERLNARLVDFESEVGKPSEITSEQVEPTLWGNIAALLDRNEPEDFKATNDWKKILDQVAKLNKSVIKEGQTNVEFRETLVNLCTEFKSDIKYLDRSFKELQLDMKNVTQPSAQLFGSIQNPAESDMGVLKQQHTDLEERFEQLNNSIEAFTTHTDGGNEGVEIGDLCFPSRADPRVWVQENLAKMDFPFGVFLDVYSFFGSHPNWVH